MEIRYDDERSSDIVRRIRRLAVRDRIKDNLKNGIWVTPDGRKLRVQDMDSSHLRNCVSFISRNSDFPFGRRFQAKMRFELWSRHWFLRHFAKWKFKGLVD